MKLRLPVLLATSAVLALSACSSTSDAADESKLPPALHDEGVSDGGGAATAEPTESAESEDETVAMGEEATYESSTQTLRVKVAEAKCGLDEVEHAKFNDSWDGMDDDEAFVSYDAQEGKSLCAVTLSITNAGDSPAEPPYPADKIALEDGTSHSRSMDDEMASDAATDALTEDPNDMPSLDPLNPGDTREYVHVVSVPKDAKATSLSYPNEHQVLQRTQEQIEFALA